MHLNRFAQFNPFQDTLYTSIMQVPKAVPIYTKRVCQWVDKAGLTEVRTQRLLMNKYKINLNLKKGKSSVELYQQLEFKIESVLT